jgi:outer membrane immunogenic protein
MKKQLLASAAVVALAAANPALAAPAPAVFSWTGFYVGGNAGYSWGNAKSNFTDPGFADGFGNGFSGELPASFPTTLRPNGGIAGIQFGYNRQVAPSWVLGIEADFQNSLERSITRFRNNYGCDTEGPGCSLSQTRDASIQWFDTLRGRAGWLFSPTLLVYVTGGWAVGKVGMLGSVTDSSSNTGASFVFGDSRIKSGPVFGVGFEGVLPNSTDFTWKVEYLYIDFGSIGGTAFEPITGGPYTWNTKFIDNIIRVGINYHIPWH